MKKRFAVLILILSFTSTSIPAYAQTSPSEEEVDELNKINEKVLSLYQQERYQEAIAYAEQSLEQSKKIFGNRSNEYATFLNNLAFLYDSQGRYGEAEPLYKDALEIKLKLLGKEHLDTANSFNNLAFLYDSQGRYVEAEPLYKDVLEIKLKLLGKEHPDTASSFNNLARLYSRQGRYVEAEPLLKDALEIFLKILGKEHPDTASSFNNLAFLYLRQGRYREAEPLFKDALEIRLKILGKEHPDTAFSLNDLAFLYDSQGRYGEAEPLYKDALEIRLKILGKEHPDTAFSFNNLAELYSRQGRYRKAEPLYKDALEIRLKILGKEHPDMAQSSNSLAALYDSQGRYGEAEPLYKDALEILLKIRGKEHPDTASSFNNLAFLYLRQGRYGEAEPLLKDALEIFLKILGKGHPYTASSLNNLALLYFRQGRYGEAEPLYKDALEIYLKILGKEHSDTVKSFSNLAELYFRQGRYGEAEPLLKDALEIYLKILGKEHHYTAGAMNSLAFMYFRQGRYGEAEPLYKDALEILLKIRGKEHPYTANSFNNLALLYVRLLRWKDAAQLFFVSGQSQEAHIQTNFPISTPEQVFRYLKQEEGSMEALISASLTAPQTESSKTDLLNISFDSVLRLKGRSADFEKSYLSLLQKGKEEPEIAIMIDRQRILDGQYQQLIQQPESERDGQKISSVKQEIDTLQQQLRQQLPPSSPSVSAQQLVEYLPEKTLLMEWVVYKRFNFDYKGEEWSEERYAVFVARGKGDVHLQDIGSVRDVDDKINMLLPFLSNEGSDKWKAPSREVYEVLLKPLMPLLKDKERWLISPDGLLSQLPFEALLGEQGEPLMVQHEMVYLASGRALSSIFQGQQGPVAPTNGPVLIANPDFGPFRDRSEKHKHLYPFQNLPETVQEIEAVQNYLTAASPKTLVGKEVNEMTLKELKRPALLHISTHGFAYDRVDKKANPLAAMRDVGLALAGANDAPWDAATDNDGVLDASEVLEMDLEGTRLVVLSACNTGQGVQTQGQGVVGLRRSFELAGAQSQVFTLWEIDPELDSYVFPLYYKYLGDGMGRAAALRQVKLDLMRNPDTSHPFYWGPLVFSGDWTPLHREDDSEQVRRLLGVAPGAGGCASCQVAAPVGGQGQRLLLGGLLMAVVAWRRRVRTAA
jgi:tetratricopeptide (TPR) repeat protein